MNLQQLLQQYTTDQRTQRIVATLEKKKPTAVQLKGLIGSQLGFVIAATRTLTAPPFLIIASDKEEAAYWQNDITALLDKNREALFFPDSYRRPMGFDKLDRTNVLQRRTVNGEQTRRASQGARHCRDLSRSAVRESSCT